MLGPPAVPLPQPFSTLRWGRVSGGSAFLHIPPPPRSSLHPHHPTWSSPKGSQTPGSSRVGAAAEAPLQEASRAQHCPVPCRSSPPSLGTAAMVARPQEGGRAAKAEPGLPLGESRLQTAQGRSPAKHGAVEPSAPQHSLSCEDYPPSQGRTLPPGFE